jgi:DNA-binding MarR family transcriptional regulator
VVSRARDAEDARAWRLRLTLEGHRVVGQFLLARLISRFTDDVNQHLTELGC